MHISMPGDTSPEYDVLMYNLKKKKKQKEKRVERGQKCSKEFFFCNFEEVD